MFKRFLKKSLLLTKAVHLFDQKYRNIVKCYYNLIAVFYINML